jgi:hypothetical protein
MAAESRQTRRRQRRQHRAVEQRDYQLLSRGDGAFVVDAHGPWQFPPPPPTVLRLPRPVAQGQHGACNSALHTVVAHHRYLSFERLLSVLGCSSVHVYDKSESGLLAANAAAAQCNVYRVPNVGCAQPCW